MPSGRRPARDRQPRAAVRSRRARAARPSTAPSSNLPRRAPGQYPLTISQEPVFIQLFRLRTSPVFPRADLRRSPDRRDTWLNTDGEPGAVNLVIVEHSFYRVRYALG